MGRSKFVRLSRCNDVASIERSFRDDAGRALATLAKMLGDIEAAEDAIQDAYLVALERWPREGHPKHASAWILTTARHRAIDKLRRERRGREKAERLAALEFGAPPRDPFAEDREMNVIPDDRLGLMFACCHPGLGVEARIALTLRTLGGLSTEEIAEAFLVPSATIAQRLVRVKRKIRDAAIPLDVPAPERLPERLADVCSVLYLIFNEGYLASAGDSLVRRDLCDEAIRLTRVLAHLMPQEPEVMGLLALMLYHHSRRDARSDSDGRLIPLAEQDRKLWDDTAIAEANAFMERAARHQFEGPYQLQAAIAAEHARARELGRVDWERIAELYAHLAAIAPSPIVDLNRAVALGFACGPLLGLAALDAIDARALETYHPAYVARADFLRRLGREAEARDAYAAALALTQNARERAFLEAKMLEAGASVTPRDDERDGR